MCKCHESAFDCIQGRGCPTRCAVSACNAQGASACSELLEADEDDRHMAAVAKLHTAFLAVLLVAGCATVAYFLPALKALVNN